MKRIWVTILILTLLSSCVSRNDLDKAMSKCDSLYFELERRDDIIKIMRDSIDMLSYPADQRYDHILRLIESNEFDKAEKEILCLQLTFPNSTEALNCNQQNAIIEKKRAILRAEEERAKALGFKVFNDKMNVTINEKNGDILKCTFSGFNFGRIFSFDYIDDVSEYHYRDADKDNIYILANLALSTKAKYAIAPSLYACSIVDGKLKKMTYFDREYASWRTYGAYIGNYSETSHDFSKVSTVNYKLGAEISLEDAKKPIVIVMFKGDIVGSVEIDGLDIEGVKKYCEVIKIINRNKM